MINLLLNILWLILGGLCMGLAWFLIGLIAFITIIGIPWGRACFVMGIMSLWPFGREVVDRREFGSGDIGTSAFGTIGNIIWFLIAGLWLAIGHLIAAIACIITIIGIPFGLQHIKLAGLAVFPIGKTVVDKSTMKVVRMGRIMLGDK